MHRRCTAYGVWIALAFPLTGLGEGVSAMAFKVGNTAVKFSVQAGANLYSIQHRGIELFKQPEKLEELPGFMFGCPILYPTPNRVRGAAFSWNGKEFRFKANEKTNFLHGLAHNVPWKSVSQEISSDKALIFCELPFEPGKPWFEAFPFPHVLRLEIEIRDGAVRWTYAVDNSKGTEAVPFGFGLHPWFLYQGERRHTHLTAPATHWMEAEEMLPTGKLVPLEGSKFDAQNPISLEGFVIDDVYYGMKPERPATIEFKDRQMKIELHASGDFTHLVVYTPADKPWFCVENQTSSTDAHNLYARGLKQESHLLVVPPGGVHKGWVEMRFGKP